MLKLTSAGLLMNAMISRTLLGLGAKCQNPATLSIVGENPTVKEFLTVQTVSAQLAHTE